MARQPINLGAVAGDGTGESLFDAFQKVNANETELYAAKTEVVANEAALPVAGETTKIYMALDTGVVYRWSGSAWRAITVPIDANGIIQASVSLRTGNLADLLQVATAGDGEVAVASDADALVVYKGTPSVGVVYGRTTQVGFFQAYAEFSTFTNAVASLVKLGESAGAVMASSAYFAGLASPANDWFILPPASVASHIQFFVPGSFTTADNGAQVIFELQYDSSVAQDGSAWTSLGIQSGVIGGIPSAHVGKKARIVCTQSTGGTLYSAAFFPIVV